MKLRDRLKDNYVTGVILAVIIIPVSYFISNGLRSILVSYKGDPFIYPPPAAQLFSLVISVIIFRVLMINFDKEKIGKGYFLILVLTVLGYFFIYNHMRSNR